MKKSKIAGSQYQASTITAQIDAPVIRRIARRTIPHSAGSSALKARRRPPGALVNKANGEIKSAGTNIQYAGPELAEVCGARGLVKVDRPLADPRCLPHPQSLASFAAFAGQ